nr:non-structural maintenance of chromosomes element 3 homolog isoform X2 [Podarcis muralis]
MSHSKRSSKGAGPSQAQHTGSDDEGGTLSLTMTPSQLRNTLERRPRSQVELKAQELVQFILFKDQKKIPVKRADVLKHVIKDYKDVFPVIIRRASGIFQLVFGLELVELDSRNPTYILINRLPPLEQSLEDDDIICKMGLLLAILSLIFMKGNVAKESAVWELLKRLRIDSLRGRCKAFGDVKKLVTEEFVKQKYLEYTRLPHTDPPEFEFRWGPRAVRETSKKEVLQFVAKIQKRDPKSWMSHYQEAEIEANAARRK